MLRQQASSPLPIRERGRHPSLPLLAAVSTPGVTLLGTNAQESQSREGRSAWGGVCLPERKDPRPPPEGLAGTVWAQGAGCSLGPGGAEGSPRPAPLVHIWRRPSAVGGPVFPPLEPRPPPRTHSWPGPLHPRVSLGHPHLVNRTVPCSSGLRLTACQLCRISSGSGRSMLAQGRGAQGWDPRGASTVTARAAPSPWRRGPLRAPCSPCASARWGSATAPSSP